MLEVPGARLPQTPDSVVSLQSEDYSIKTLWTCFAEKKDVIVSRFIKKKTGNVKRRQAAQCVLLCFLFHSDHVQAGEQMRCFVRDGCAKCNICLTPAVAHVGQATQGH